MAAEPALILKPGSATPRRLNVDDDINQTKHAVTPHQSLATYLIDNIAVALLFGPVSTPIGYPYLVDIDWHGEKLLPKIHSLSNTPIESLVKAQVACGEVDGIHPQAHSPKHLQERQFVVVELMLFFSRHHVFISRRRFSMTFLKISMFHEPTHNDNPAHMRSHSIDRLHVGHNGVNCRRPRRSSISGRSMISCTPSFTNLSPS